MRRPARHSPAWSRASSPVTVRSTPPREDWPSASWLTRSTARLSDTPASPGEASLRSTPSSVALTSSSRGRRCPAASASARSLRAISSKAARSGGRQARCQASADRHTPPMKKTEATAALEDRPPIRRRRQNRRHDNRRCGDRDTLKRSRRRAVLTRRRTIARSMGARPRSARRSRMQASMRVVSIDGRWARARADAEFAAASDLLGGDSRVVVLERADAEPLPPQARESPVRRRRRQSAS